MRAQIQIITLISDLRRLLPRTHVFSFGRARFSLKNLSCKGATLLLVVVRLRAGNCQTHSSKGEKSRPTEEPLTEVASQAHFASHGADFTVVSVEHRLWYQSVDYRNYHGRSLTGTG